MKTIEPEELPEEANALLNLIWPLLSGKPVDLIVNVLANLLIGVVYLAGGEENYEVLKTFIANMIEVHKADKRSAGEKKD